MQGCSINIVNNPPFPKQYARELLLLEKGEGNYLYDKSGKKYLDFAAGIAVNSLGYGCEDLVKAGQAQMEQLMHTSNLYTTEATLHLAYKLIATGHWSAVHFGNSGTEAIEAAIKYACIYAMQGADRKPGKFLVFENAFHGRTLGALSCTPNPKYQQSMSELLIDSVTTLPLNDSDALEKTLDNTYSAVLVEPVQGEGGLDVVTPEFAQALNRLCKQHDVLLIADEIQTGIGRCGEFFASAAVGLQPDMITLAKALAAGMPLSAVLVPEKIDSLLNKGDHGTTFGGNPVSAAIASVVIDKIFHPVFLTEVKKKGEVLAKGLRAMADRMPVPGKVKGLGLLAGVEVSFEKKENVYFERIPEILNQCREQGLLLLRSGAKVLRIAPPLTIKPEEIEQGLSILEKVINQKA